ncbi:MAG: hypothetical protein ABI960_10185, partial [Candidatus Eisenbacteria bacterium]
GGAVPIDAGTGLTGDGAVGGAPATPILAWSGAAAGGESDLLGRRAQAGLVLDPVFVLATQTPNQTEPALAFGANHWLAAWVDDRFGSGERQVRIGLTDSARFETPNPASVAFAVSRAGLDQSHPAVVYDGTNFNLFWQESRGGRLTVQGARFTAGGAPIDTFAVSDGAWNQYEPSAATFDDGTVFVAWTDTRAGATERDIWAATYLGGAVVTGATAIANEAGVREEHPSLATIQQYAALLAFERSQPSSTDRGIRAALVYPGLSYWTQTVAENPGSTFAFPRAASNGEDVLVSYQSIVFSDGPSLHVPLSRRFDGDNQYFHFQNAMGPGSYTPANPVIASAGYDFVGMWSTLLGGGPDLNVRALDPNGAPLGSGPIRLMNDPIVDTPGAGAQGQGDRVGFGFLRSLSDSSWGGLQLFAGDARDTLRGKVLINEFLAHPSQGRAEFYEVFNTSGRSFLLNGWTLRINGNPNVIADCYFNNFSKTRPGTESAFGPGGPERVLGNPCSELPNQEFFSDSSFIGFPEDPDQGHLPDRGAVLELYSPGNALVDRVGYGYLGGAPVSGAIPNAIAPAAIAPAASSSAARAGEPSIATLGDSTQLSTARIPSGTDSGNNATDFNLTPTPTPNTANTGTTSALGTTIFVGRAYWHPSTGQPTIELLNPSSSQSYDFSGWYISNNNATERIGVGTNAWSNLKAFETRLLRRGEAGSFTFPLDELSVIYLLDPNFARYEQLGWSRPDQLAPDQCVTRFQGTGGTHDGFDWFTCGGQDNIASGELRYTACNISAPVTVVPATPSRLAFAGAWPNPAHSGGPAMLVFSLPGVSGDAPVRARLVLDDVAGRRVATLIDGELSPGEHRVPLLKLDGSTPLLRAGTYYADLLVGGERLRRTIVFLD